jgi:hypothetical protein
MPFDARLRRLVQPRSGKTSGLIAAAQCPPLGPGCVRSRAPEAEAARGQRRGRRLRKAFCAVGERLSCHTQRRTPLPAQALVTFENSPSNVAAADQPLFHFISIDAVVSAESAACAAPFTTKEAPGSVWKKRPPFVPFRTKYKPLLLRIQSLTAEKSSQAHRSVRIPVLLRVRQ